MSFQKHEEYHYINIILVNYKNYIDTYECVYSLLSQEYQKIRIFIIDNGSQNNSYTAILELLNKEECPDFSIYKKFVNHKIKIKKGITYIDEKKEVKLGDLDNNIFFIELNSNKGFGEANNYAIHFIQKYFNDINSYIALINNDTFVSKDLLSSCVQTIKNNKKLIALTCTILYKDYRELKIWSQGGIFNPIKASGYHLKIGESFNNNQNTLLEVNFINGCFIFLRYKDITCNNILFDKRFFLYAEDLDFSLLMQKKNFKLLVIQDKTLFHKVSNSHKSNKLLQYYTNRNRFIIARKWLSPFRMLLFILYFMSSRTYLAFKHKNKLYWSGIYDGIIGKTGAKQFN